MSTTSDINHAINAMRLDIDQAVVNGSYADEEMTLRFYHDKDVVDRWTGSARPLLDALMNHLLEDRELARKFYTRLKTLPDYLAWAQDTVKSIDTTMSEIKVEIQALQKDADYTTLAQYDGRFERMAQAARGPQAAFAEVATKIGLPNLEALRGAAGDGSFARYLIEQLRTLQKEISDALLGKTEEFAQDLHDRWKRVIEDFDLADRLEFDGWLERLAQAAEGPQEAWVAAAEELRIHFDIFELQELKRMRFAAGGGPRSIVLSEALLALQAETYLRILEQSELPQNLTDQIVIREIGRLVDGLYREISRADRNYLQPIKEALSALQLQWDESREIGYTYPVDMTGSIKLRGEIASNYASDERLGPYLIEAIPDLLAAVEAALVRDDQPSAPGFREQYPLDFHLWDAAQQPVLSSLAVDGQKLTLSIHNTSGNDVKLQQLPDEHGYHFALRFRRGTLLNPENIFVQGPGGPWAVAGASKQDVQEISLRAPEHSELTIAAGHKLVLEVHNVIADPGPGSRTTRVQLVYQSLPQKEKDLIGTREKTLSVTNRVPPARLAVHQPPLQVGFDGPNTILNDGGSQNTLTVQLTNMDSRRHTLHFPATLPGRTKILLSFDDGDNEQRGWGLATLDELLEIVPTLSRGKDATGQLIDAWVPVFTSEGGRAQWIFTPPLETTEGYKLAAGDALTLAIKKITSSLPAGPTHLHLHCENVAGFPDRTYTLPILKSPLIYHEFHETGGLHHRKGRVGIGTAGPTYALDIAGQDKALRLSGTGTNGAQAKLAFGDKENVYLQEDDDNQLTIHAHGGLALTGGNVGIGTNAQNANLDITGKLNVTDSAGIEKSLTTGGSVGIGTESTESPLTIKSSTASALTILSPVKGGYGLDQSCDETHLKTWVSDKQANIEINGELNLMASDTLYLLTKNSPRLTINPEGNVGIGTTDPKTELHIVGGSDAETSKTNSGFLIIGDAAATHLALDNNEIIAKKSGTEASPLFLQWSGGNVAIGKNSAKKAKLQIQGSTSSPDNNIGYKVYRDGVYSYAHDDWRQNEEKDLSLYCSHDIACREFLSFSDARIKTIQGRSDGAADLVALSRIEITDFTYKDVIEKGSSRHKKVSAQQVETVYPQAVSKNTDVVPDIYARATVKNGWVNLPTDLKAGERVRLIGETEEGIHEVLEVRDGAFRTGSPPAGEELFVFGREVNDFGLVDYEAIAMLNVSATQELARRLEAKEDEIEVLKQRLHDQDARLARLERVEARLDRLEQTYRAAGTAPAKPDSPTVDPVINQAEGIHHRQVDTYEEAN